MGNCLRKNALDPNRPVEIAQPPPGVPPIRKSSAQLQKKKERTSSLPSNILQDRRQICRDGKITFFNKLSEGNKHIEENRCKDQRRDYRQREWKRSKSRKENDSTYTNIHTSQPTSRDVKVVKPNMDEVYRARKLNCFCLKILEAATRKFSEKNFIGQGGFGDVYIGYINSHTMTAAKRKGGDAVAVKRLCRKGFQGQQEWQNELELLSRLNHPHVVKLIGYCSQGEHRMLVYEYLTEGSLEDHLLSENDRVLSWRQRIKIALGVARGLEFLHTYWRPVIHRDVKASNVLLDEDFNAKLSDFGLAKFGPIDDKSHVSTRVLGTQGYFAPEYIITGRLTVKADVYSFGVVLLEILMGTDAVKKHAHGMAGLWAKPYLSNKVELRRVIDEKLGNIRMEEAQEFAEIVLKCLTLEPKTRPTMTQVVADLEQLELHIGGCNHEFLRLSTGKKRTSHFEHLN